MNRQKRAQLIQKLLDEYFPHPEIPLAHHDGYTLLIAVLLSGQCTDARVNQVTPKLFSLAKTPAEMAALPVRTIQEIIRPCGLSERKARSISMLSQILMLRYDGMVPCSQEALEALPGVGPKTASVVLVQAFGIPAFPVDTHIHRLAKRWGLSRGKTVRETECDLKAAFPEEAWAKLHLQMIYYGRTYCKARGHSLEACPICCALMDLDLRSDCKRDTT